MSVVDAYDEVGPVVACLGAVEIRHLETQTVVLDIGPHTRMGLRHTAEFRLPFAVQDDPVQMATSGARLPAQSLGGVEPYMTGAADRIERVRDGRHRALILEVAGDSRSDAVAGHIAQQLVHQQPRVGTALIPGKRKFRDGRFIEAYKSQCFKDIYFVDPVTSIMDNLKNRFQTFVYSTENKSHAHFLVQKGETVAQIVQGNVCIVGVGGLMICDILKSLAQNNLLQAQRLILGPHRDPEKIVELIAKDALFKKYKLIKQKDVMENGRKREFFIFDAI